MKRVLTNDFSWSKSRHEKLAECERAYFFQYYRSWGGWEQRAPEEVKTLFGLKKLHSRFTWAGSAVHGAVRDALRSYRAQRPVDAAALIERVHQDMLAQFRHSKARRYRADRRTFEGLVEEMRNRTFLPTDSVEEYMRDIVERHKMLNAEAIRMDTAEHFLGDLDACGLIKFEVAH